MRRGKATPQPTCFSPGRRWKGFERRGSAAQGWPRMIRGSTCSTPTSPAFHRSWSTTAHMRCWSAKPSSSRSERRTLASMSPCAPCLKASTTSSSVPAVCPRWTERSRRLAGGCDPSSVLQSWRRPSSRTTCKRRRLTSKEKSMSNSPSKRAAPIAYTRFSLDKSTPSLWRVTFDNPPINLIDAVMMKELLNLLTEIERDKRVGVVLFDSADPDFFLAHYDIAGDPAELEGVETTAGRHPFTELHIRLSKSPAVTISAIRGRARGAGSEFALATDIRFASRERAVLGQMEVGFGAVPGAGPTSWLPRLVGRGRAFEILLGGEDFNGELAERYGYVNRAIPDDEFEDFVSRFARRLSTFDRQGVADIKHFVNRVSLPPDEEILLQMIAFGQAALRPAMEGRVSKAFEDGFQERSDVELRLGEYV